MKVSSIKFLFTRSFVIFTAIFCIILASATVKAANTRVKVVKKNGLLKRFLKMKALQRQKFDPTFLLKKIKPEVLSTFVNKYLTGELGMKHRDMEVVKASVPVLIKALKGGQIEEHDLNDLRNISNTTANNFMKLSNTFDKAMPILNSLGRSFKMLGGKGLPSDGSFSDAHGNLVDEGSFLVGESRQRVQSTISEGREASLTNDGEEEAIRDGDVW